MKIKTVLFALIPLLFSGCSLPMYVTTESSVPQPVADTYPEGVIETNYQVFYDQLGPYGNWVDYPDYGYVWHPNVDVDFKPYATNGHWLYSDQGWAWVSNYNWGWAPFHYGTWFYDDSYGWLWLPGHDWAPAWVTWGRSGDYYCWAPLAPNADADRWTPPQRSWNFVPSRHMTRPDLDHYVVNNDFTHHQRVTIINNISNVNNYNGNHRGGRGNDRDGNNTIPVGINNGRGGTDNRGNNNPPNNNGNYNNRGNDNGRNNNNPSPNNNGNNGRNNNAPNNNGNNNNRGNDNGRNTNNPPPNNNGNNGRNNNPPNNNPSNNGNNAGRNNNNPPNNNPNNNVQPVNRPNNPNAPSYDGNANNNKPNVPRPNAITVPDNNTGVSNRTGNNNGANNKQPANNGNYNRGPAVNQVENATNDRVPQRTIQATNRPGPPTVTNTTVTVFKPRVQAEKQNPNGQRPAPKQVQPFKPKAQQ